MMSNKKPTGSAESSSGVESRTDQKKVAEAVHKACLQAAREGFQDASISGLCSEGAMEAAIGAIQSLDLNAIIETSNKESSNNEA